jgi:hypothetical protein
MTEDDMLPEDQAESFALRSSYWDTKSARHADPVGAREFDESWQQDIRQLEAEVERVFAANPHQDPQAVKDAICENFGKSVAAHIREKAFENDRRVQDLIRDDNVPAEQAVALAELLQSDFDNRKKLLRVLQVQLGQICDCHIRGIKYADLQKEAEELLEQRPGRP